MRKVSVPLAPAVVLMVGILACGPVAQPQATATSAPSPTPVAAATEPPPTIPVATEAPPPGTIQGLLWKDRCLLTGGEAGEPLVLGEGCVSTGPNPWEWGANQVYEPGFEPGIGGVTVHLGAGPCPLIGLSSTVTMGDGTYAFDGLPPGAYCVSFDPLSDGNDAHLIPGGLSFPTRGGEAHVTVALDPGETEIVNFGWTFQFGD